MATKAKAVSWSVIKQINEHIFEVPSDTTDRLYRIDVSVPHCTCEGFARMFNTSKGRGDNPPIGYCKHLTGTLQAITAGRFHVPTRQDDPIGHSGLSEKEKTLIRYRSVKAQEELRRDLADLRRDDE